MDQWDTIEADRLWSRAIPEQTLDEAASRTQSFMFVLRAGGCYSLCEPGGSGTSYYPDVTSAKNFGDEILTRMWRNMSASVVASVGLDPQTWRYDADIQALIHDETGTSVMFGKGIEGFDAVSGDNVSLGRYTTAEEAAQACMPLALTP